MRKSIQTSAIFLALTLGTAVSHAQQAPDQGPQGPPHHKGEGRGPGQNPEFEAKMLTRRLSLTPEQEAQITPILAEQHEQMKALRPAPGTPRPTDGTRPDFKAMHEQTKAIMDSSKEKVEAILTPEQKEKFEKMHDRGFRGGPGGPGGPRDGHRPPPPQAAPPA